MPIKVLFCHPDTEYLVTLSGAFNRPSNLSTEVIAQLEEKKPREFDFHGVSSYYQAMNALIRTNFEGRPTEGYYGELPFHLFACYLEPPSSRKGKSDTDGWDVLNQINNKLDLSSSALLEKYDAQGNLTEELYRPPLCSIALLDPQHETVDLMKRLMQLRVYQVIPSLLQLGELQFYLRQCYQNYFRGSAEIRLTHDIQKSRTKEPTAVRQRLRWQSFDDNDISYRGISLDQISFQELQSRGIDMANYQLELKDLFLNTPKYRDLSLKLTRRRYTQE